MFFLLQEFVGEISVMIKSIETQTKIVLNGASISGDQPQSSLFDGSCCGNFAQRSSMVNIAPGQHLQRMIKCEAAVKALGPGILVVLI